MQRHMYVSWKDSDQKCKQAITGKAAQCGNQNGDATHHFADATYLHEGQMVRQVRWHDLQIVGSMREVQHTARYEEE